MKVVRFSLLAGFLGGILGPIFAQLADPIPQSIEKGDLVLEIENWLQAPATSSGSTRARLSVMKPAYDGSGRIFVNDLRGPFYIVENDALTEYVDFNDVFPNFIDQNRLGTGFHSFAFHPDFETNGRFYTAHTESAGSGTADFGPPIAQTINVQSVVVEWTATDPAAATFSGTRREVLRIEYNDQVHNVQEIAFNHFIGSGDPDYGCLYICSGDGAAVANEYPEIGHRLDTVYGTLLRIDPLGRDSANGQYGIPADNPFVADNDANTLAEIYAWGFRNPHRIIWDSANPDRLYLFDIGERNLEEINLIVKGGDHGYSEREGTFLLDPIADRDVVFPLPGNDGDFDYVYPVAQYDHDEGRAIAGGQIYRGDVWPELDGKMIFGDIVNGRIFLVDADSLALGSQAPIEELGLKNIVERSLLQIMGDSRADLRFGIAEDGEVFIVTKRDGRVRRFVALPTQPETPNGTGLLTNVSTNATIAANDSLIVGFVIDADEGSRRVLIRGAGPGLGAMNVPDTLADPVIAVHRTVPPPTPAELVASNTNWGDNSNAASIAATSVVVGAFPLAEGSSDAALMLFLSPGSYTVTVTSESGAAGRAIAEVYKIP